MRTSLSFLLIKGKYNQNATFLTKQYIVSPTYWSILLFNILGRLSKTQPVKILSNKNAMSRKSQSWREYWLPVPFCLTSLFAKFYIVYCWYRCEQMWTELLTDFMTYVFPWYFAIATSKLDLIRPELWGFISKHKPSFSSIVFWSKIYSKVKDLWNSTRTLYQEGLNSTQYSKYSKKKITWKYMFVSL